MHIDEFNRANKKVDSVVEQDLITLITILNQPALYMKFIVFIIIDS